MVSRLSRLHRLPLGRWLLGLVLVMANGPGWTCADPAAGAGQRVESWVERAAVAHVAHRVVQDVAAHGAVEPAHAVPGTHPAYHPCGHAHANADGAPGSDPCTSPGSPCVGLCATLCLPAAGAGPALPFTPARLPATGLAEACPQLAGWTGTGRSVPPESPPPIV